MARILWEIHKGTDPERIQTQIISKALKMKMHECIKVQVHEHYGTVEFPTSKERLNLVREWSRSKSSELG